MDSDQSEEWTRRLADNLSNYELHEQIGHGAMSQVYTARCKRGRLRNRLVVIKMTPSNKTTDADPIRDPKVSSAVHAALFHPSIISLISAYSAPASFHQVLEYCESGSLADFLYTRYTCRLDEDELRGVARPLVDALTYLKKERVLHRDIKPSNIMLTSEYRLKLSGFGSCVRLLTIDSTETAFCGSPNYISPEILLGRPYSFPTDVWSLGCVLVTCLSGQPAFHALTPKEVIANIYDAQYVLPEDVSYEAQDFISGFLQKQPQDRIPLHRILAHPFFKPSLPVKPLSSQPTDTSRQNDRRSQSQSMLGSAKLSKQYPSHLSRCPSKLQLASSKYNAQKSVKRMPLEDITNLYQDTSTRHCMQQPPSPPQPATVFQELRRRRSLGFASVGQIDSRPLTPALMTDSGTLHTSSVATLQERVKCPTLLSEPLKQPPRQSLQASPRKRLKHILSDSCVTRPLLLSKPSNAAPLRMFSKATTSTAVSHGLSPIIKEKVKHLSEHSEKQEPLFNTRRLKSQTYKISQGQLVVLPSKSLLVDFREGERRKGRPGKKILLISPDGLQIEVYDAPHLSTPCCLAEPNAKYTAAGLTHEYLGMYEDAVLLVDRLSSRVAKLVHYLDDAKCTLMSNGPPGDIEILIPGTEDPRAAAREAIRLRLRRKRCTLELSRHVLRHGEKKDVGEWTKKILPLTRSLELLEVDLLDLDTLERLAMTLLGDFLRVCNIAEHEACDATPQPVANGRERLQRSLHNTEGPSEESSSEVKDRITSRAGSRASVATSVTVLPRPRRFSNTAMLR